jgi:hypothetical protein|tara:strand:+ start:2680 stop:2901 length:222 start_codon:yes stop_codon:yes gene_type:complete
MKQNQSNTDVSDLVKRLTDHEKECAKRWGETTVELRELKHHAYENAKKWDRLNWYTLTGIIIILSTNVANLFK